jgi:hypothetical protein
MYHSELSYGIRKPGAHQFLAISVDSSTSDPGSTTIFWRGPKFPSKGQNSIDLIVILSAYLSYQISKLSGEELFLSDKGLENIAGCIEGRTLLAIVVSFIDHDTLLSTSSSA